MREHQLVLLNNRRNVRTRDNAALTAAGQRVDGGRMACNRSVIRTKKNISGFRQTDEILGCMESMQPPPAVEANRSKLYIVDHGRGPKPPADNANQIALMRAESREILRAAWLR